MSHPCPTVPGKGLCMATDDQSYFAPLKKSRARFTVQGSRFIATLAPVDDQEEVSKILDQVRVEFPDATHHTYACRIGSGSTLIERSSDDREPAGTAGAPMLQVLQGHNISDALVIGTRYFGGTKLGIGGLTRAYRDCVRRVLDKAKLKKKEPLQKYSLQLSYEDMGPITRLIETLEGIILNVDYSDTVTMHIQVPTREEANLRPGFESACRGRGTIKKL